MKKCLTVFLLLVALLFTSCEWAAVVDTDDINDYKYTVSKVIENTDIGEFGKISLSISSANAEIVQYRAKSVSLLPVGEQTQMLLSVKYDNDSFKTEVNRISEITEANPVLYDTEHFHYPAYVASIGYNDASEYVLVDEENNTLHYVLLQTISPEKIVFDEEYMPIGYSDYGTVGDFHHTIYHHLLYKDT